MKKIIGIFMVMVFMVLFASMAFGEEQWKTEVVNFCNDHKSLKQFVQEDECTYNIFNGCAYIYGKVTMFDDMYEYMDKYGNYLNENFPDFAKDVKYEFTFTGTTEHTEMLCVWLKLDNGKTFSDYEEGEPEVAEMAGLLVFEKN